MQSGCNNFNRLRKENADHLIEKVGAEIRSSFVWGNDNKIIVTISFNRINDVGDKVVNKVVNKVGSNIFFCN